jgi:hypothetical protein
VLLVPALNRAKLNFEQGQALCLGLTQRIRQQSAVVCKPAALARPLAAGPAFSWPPPIFRQLALHCRARRVFALQPIRGATGAVARAFALRNYPLEAKSAGVFKD